MAWVELTFDQAIDTLRGWAGRQVAVEVGNDDGPVGAAFLVGTLRERPWEESEPPFGDPDSFRFVLDEAGECGFLLDRSWFDEAAYTAERNALQVHLGSGGVVVLDIRAEGPRLTVRP